MKSENDDIFKNGLSKKVVKISLLSKGTYKSIANFRETIPLSIWTFLKIALKITKLFIPLLAYLKKKNYGLYLMMIILTIWETYKSIAALRTGKNKEKHMVF
jgi:hypothetical protein